MIIDGISYSFSNGTMTVFVHKNGKERSIANVEITDRDFDQEDDAEYMQNLSVEIASEQGYQCIK